MSQRKIIKKKSVLCIAVILILVVIMSAFYIFQEDFRNWIDIHILNKDITEEDIISIDLDTSKSNQVYVYNKYIALLNNQVITLYNNYGDKLTNINININTAIFDSSEKYLAIAEKGGGEICLILDKNYLWSNKVEGEIFQVHVNKNGYVAVITKDKTYKSILTLYNSDGTQLFKSYFSYTRIIDVSISNDNKYVAIGEIDSSGVLIKCNIKILSIQDAKAGKEDAYIYTYNADNGKLLTDINYQSKGQLICMYDDSIHIIKDKENKEILSINNKQVTFMSANLENSAVYVEEEKTGVFKTSSHINIINTQNDQISTYNLEDVLKSLYAKDNIIAVNTGTEVYFLNTKGWLIKKYSTKHEISNIMFSEHIAGLVFKDKIIIVDL